MLDSHLWRTVHTFVGPGHFLQASVNKDLSALYKTQHKPLSLHNLWVFGSSPLQLLRWCRANGYKWSASTCTNAARHGHLNVLKWCRANGCEWDSWACANAAKGGHLEVLRWCRANGCEWDSWTCAYAAEGGQLDVLKWCRANGCRWNQLTCSHAAGGGHLEVLKWCRANGGEWDSWACANAAGGGHLEVLKWCRVNGCEWDAWTCAYAARGGHLHVLQWCRANGCEWDSWTCTYVVVDKLLPMVRAHWLKGGLFMLVCVQFHHNEVHLKMISGLRDPTLTTADNVERGGESVHEAAVRVAKEQGFEICQEQLIHIEGQRKAFMRRDCLEFFRVEI